MSGISTIRNDDQCSGFEPQNWRRDRCKKCFRLKEQHTRARSGSENIGSKIKKLIPSTSGSKSLDLGQVPDSKTPTSLVPSSSWRQKLQSKSTTVERCDQNDDQSCNEAYEQESEQNGSTDTTKNVSTNAAIAENDGNSETTTPPSTSARKTRLVILKAEVSVDGNPVSDEISVETSIGSDSPSARSPCAATTSMATTSAAFRQKSPDTQSLKSFDGSIASSSEYLSARSVPIGSRSRTSSSESVASTLMVKSDVDDVEQISLTGSDLLQSEEDEDDERSRTPTTSQNGSNLRRKLRSLRAQLKTLERRCSDLTKENERYKRTSALISPSAHPTQNLETLQKELVKSETLCQNYQLENERLRYELSSTAIPKSSGRHSSTDSLSSLQSINKQETSSLREKLSAAEQLCEELLNENENLKADLKDMQQELEEMRDQYREEEIDEFRDLQRELEQTAKNCRILQFKLRKAERRNDQTEADRQHLQEKIREILNNNGTPLEAVVDSPRLRELESELRIAKEVSVRLHNELESMDEKRCKLEDENFCFRERIRELEAREKIIDISRPKPEQQKKYNHDGTEIMCRLPPTSNSEAQLLRNLQDALERETDLRDQLKFAEHDIKMARKSVSDLETENECLMRQLSKISSTKSLSSAATSDGSSQDQSQNGPDDQSKKGGKNAKRAVMKRSLSEGHAQIELELAEQEAQVLRSKLEKMERDKENLVSKISLLEKEAGKFGGRTQFSDDELKTMVPDTYYKQKIRMLEEEVEEWKIKFETMQKAEADQDTLDRSKFTRPVSTLSTNVSPAANALKDADLKFKHDILEREVSILRQRISSLELENERISNDNRRLMTRKNIPVKKDDKVSTNGAAGIKLAGQESLSPQDKVSQMEAEGRRFLSRITSLEKENEQLSKELERRKRLEDIKRGRKNLSSGGNDDNFDQQSSICLELQDKVNELMKENDGIKSDFKNAQQKAEKNETQLAEYKQIIGMSDDQKLITMATKVEVLTNQLKEVQCRYDAFHKTMTVDRLTAATNNQERYEDMLKHKIETLEKELSEQKARTKVPWTSDFRDYLCSQIAELESTLKNSKGKEDCVTITEKIKHLHDTLKSADIENDSKSTGNLKRSLDSEVIIRQLKGQLDQSLLEKSNAIQECERATTRLLQTEERWNKELEKLRESYENQMKDLKYYLEESEKIKEEKSCALLERTASLNERTKRLNECESKIQRLEQELKQKHKDLQEKLDVEKKRAKEFETKYQKLESLYETDRQKLNTEKEKFKIDLSEIKKRYEETQADFEKLKITYERKENGWASEKAEYEKKLSKLVDDAKEIEIKAAKKAQEMSSVENQKLLTSIEKLKQSMDSENEKWSKDIQDAKLNLESKIKENEDLSKEIDRMKKELETAMSQIKDQKQQLEETRRVRDDTKEEMQRWQQTWTKERAELAHKMRQEEKVQQAEQQALHLKYESKIKIIEDSNKRAQTQLTQVRREKDQFRENVIALEKTIAENGKKAENEQKDLIQKIAELESKAEKIDDLVLQLEKEKIENQALRKTYETDKKLWTMKNDIVFMQEKAKDSIDEKGSNESSKLVEQSMALADQLRQQIEDDKRIYDDELVSLRKQFENSRNEWAKERKELTKKMKELQEAIKVKEIDRLNILSNQEQHEKDRTKFQNERDLLLQRLQETEIHQMANKYKLDKIYEQILDLASKCQQLPDTSSNSGANESQTLLRKVLEQLAIVRDDLSKAKELSKSLAKMQSQPGIGRLLLPPSGADFSDSTSVKSAPLEKSDQSDLSDLSGTHFLTNRLETSQYTATHALNNSTSRHYLSGKSPSVSSDIGPDGRYTGRLRSPSPNPRKITNYPEPPPSIIFNTAHCVEYDNEGRRHWTRKSFMQRSVSLDPAGGNSMVEDHQSSKADENVRLKLMSAVATSTTNLSIGSQSPAYRRRMANIFATLRKSTSKERRKTQCPSVTSSSDQLIETEKSEKSGYDRGRSKVFSGSRILDKIRGRSSSRGQKMGPSRDPSLDAKNLPSSATTADSSTDTIALVKSVDQKTGQRENLEIVTPSSPKATASTTKGDQGSTTVGAKYMRSSSTQSSSPSSYKASSIVGTTKEYVTRSSRTTSASNILSKAPYTTSTGSTITKPHSNFRSINPSYGSVRTLSAKFFNR